MADLAEQLNGLAAVASGANPNAPQAPVKPRLESFGPIATLLGQRANDILAATPAELGKLPALPFDLYNLASSAINYGSRKLGFGDAQLPGAEGSAQISESIRKPVEQFQEKIAGEPLNNQLLNPDLPQAIGSWSRLALPALVTAPSEAIAALDRGAQALKTGVGAIDATGKAALKTLEVASPVILRPATPLVTGLSVGVPAAIGTGIELAFPQLDEKNKLDQAAALATDQAVSGIQDTADATHIAKTAMPPQTAGFPSITGDPTWDLLAIGVLSAAGIASNKRAVIGRIVDDMAKSTGIKQPLSGMLKNEETGLTATQGLRRNLIDETTAIKDPYRKVLEELQNPNAQRQADRFEAVIDSNHGSAINTRFQSAIQWGEIPGSSVKFSPLKDTFDKWKALPETDREALGTGLSSQYNPAPLLQPIHPAWQAVQNNPALKALSDEYHDTVGKILDYMVESKSLTRSEASQAQGLLPRLLSGDNVPDRELPTFVLKHLAPDVARGLEDPFVRLPRFVDAAMRYSEFNKIRRTFIGAMENARAAGSPTADRILGKKNVKVGTANKDNVVFYRDHFGNPQNYEINDPLVRRALQYGGDMSRLHALSGTMAALARWMESGATGPLATVFGAPFALTSAIYGAGIGTVMRPLGIHAGYIDKAIQTATGGRFGLRGDILGNAAAAAPQAIRGITAILAQRAAQALHKQVVTNGLVAQMASPQALDSLATGLSNHYKRSWIHYFQQEGLLGPAVVEGINHDTLLKDVNRRLTTVGTPLRAVNDTLRFINDLLHAVSASPTAAILSLNKGKDKQLINRAIREFTGDPSKSGAFQGRLGQSIGKLTAATPWGNIFLQSGDRFFRELARHPIETLGGLTMAIGTPVISATIWNGSLGHGEYSDYQYNKRSPDRQASSIYIGLPGLPPENGLEIPVDPWMRPYKAAVELLAGSRIGALDGSLFHPDNESQRLAYSEMVRHRWEGIDDNSVARSVFEQSILPPLPPAITVPLAAAGVNARSYVSGTSIPSKIQGFSEATARDPQASELLGLHESAQAEYVVRALGANALAMAYDIFKESAKRVGEGQSASQVASNVVEKWVQNLKDAGKAVPAPSNRFLGKTSRLLDGFAAISPSQESSGTTVKAKLDGLKKINQAYASMGGNTPTNGEFVGTRQRGYQPLVGGSVSVGPQDQGMAYLAQMAHQYYTLVDKQFLGPNKDLYQQRQSIQLSTKYSPEYKRAMMNELSNQIIENNRAALTFLQQIEGAMSNQLGYQVKLDKLKLDKPISQFEKLP